MATPAHTDLSQDIDVNDDGNRLLLRRFAQWAEEEQQQIDLVERLRARLLDAEEEQGRLANKRAGLAKAIVLMNGVAPDGYEAGRATLITHQALKRLKAIEDGQEDEGSVPVVIGGAVVVNGQYRG